MEVGRDIAVLLTAIAYCIVGEIAVSINFLSNIELVQLTVFIILAEVSIGTYYDKKSEKDEQRNTI